MKKTTVIFQLWRRYDELREEAEDARRRSRVSGDWWAGRAGAYEHAAHCALLDVAVLTGCLVTFLDSIGHGRRNTAGVTLAIAETSGTV